MLKKLLRQNISKSQLLGFAVANFIGLTIILLSVQFYVDIKPLFAGNDSLIKRDFFVVTKNITALNAINKIDGFSNAEIEDIKQQGFVKKAGRFTSSQFAIYGGISTASGVNLGTDLFFEAIPKDFIDVQSDKWRFSPNNKFIPIIVPQNYLDLYNFGFASSRQMPNISGGMVQMVQMDLRIEGNGKSENLKGSIVGFSKRINTILVPEEFMMWANSRFAPNANALPSRLILEISNITDPKIATFFKEKGYKIEGENQAVGRMAYFLRMAFVICFLIGMVIFLLSFAILILSIYLILQKNREKIATLRLIGYTKSAIVRFYFGLVFYINLVTLGLSLWVVFMLRPTYMDYTTRAFGSLNSGSMIVTIAVGMMFLLLISILNLFIIKKKIE